MEKKLDMKTSNITEKNIAIIGELFPNCVREGKIDFDLLKQELSLDINDKKEKYQLTWVGKNSAIVESNKSTSNTLRPVNSKSQYFNNTKNVYIEGDNLEALKILQESYLNRIKCIYIDPPYNTGNDFIYTDNFAHSSNDELLESGQIDNVGNKLITNQISNGRFHSDWLTMMYPRLKLARNLLSKDGVIFISIDDNEQDNLKKICDEIFGENNFIACVVWKRKRGRDNSARWFSKAHEYLLVYSKNKEFFDTNFLELDDETKKAYKNPDNDPRGVYRMLGCWARGTQGGVKYDFTTKDGIYFKERLWLMSKENLSKLDSENKLIIRGDNIYRKMFITENKGKIPETLWDDVSNAANASDEIKKLFSKIIFDTPKPIPYIEEIMKIATDKDSIILDFFSGSATTAHAIMKLNSEDNGNRRFIMVQVPEKCDEKSEAFKDGYRTICEIGEERIRRAAQNIKDETDANIDYGFRVYKVDSSNMTDVYYEPSKLNQSQLNIFESNIKEDRTAEDLLTQVILDLGLTLDLNIEEKNILDNKVFFVAGNSLVACFDDRINIDIINQICDVKPLKIVFRESSFKNDSDKINTYERIKKLTPETEISVI